MLVSVLGDLAAEVDVFLERLMAGIDHDAGETLIDALLAQFEGIAMIQVDGDGDIGKADGGLDQLFQINRVGIAAGAFGNLEHYRGFFLFARFNNGLKQFHIVHIKRAERVFAFEGLGKQISGMC